MIYLTVSNQTLTTLGTIANISQDNSNGTVIQDLTITLDSNGHVY